MTNIYIDMIYREICSFVKCLIYVYEINKMFVFLLQCNL